MSESDFWGEGLSFQDTWPSSDEFLKSAEEAKEGMPVVVKAITEQGVAFTKEVAADVCDKVAYGDTEWKEVWAAASIVMFNLLVGAQQVVPELSNDVIESLSLEFALLGNAEKSEDISGIEEG